MSDNPINALASLSPEPPVPPPLPKPVSKLRWAIHLAIMAALPLVAAFGGLTTHRRGPAFTHSVHGLLTVCGYELLFVAVPFGLAWLFSRATRDELLLRWRPGYWVVPLGALYSVVIRVVPGMVAAIVIVVVALVNKTSPADVQKYALEHRPQVEKLVDIHALSHDPVYYWLNVILVSMVIGGLREEMWRTSFLAGLRALWPRAFGSVNGGIAAAAIAAIPFGVAHWPQGIPAAAMITVVGFLLGVIMVVHRSVWPSVLAHGFFDAASMAALPWVMRLLQHLQQLQHGGS